ncbi:hypothetical protein O3M35_009071 [Rhynocoris fuscipes]|uniref:Odorant receptor n=1 Tax=Rhynocoris fuscipes TaxID=488301 RepID=A0AAW1D971_9HEMI
MNILYNLCSEDDEEVDKVIYNEYWYLPRISCFYPKLNTPIWRVLSMIQFLLYISCFVYHIILLIITAIKLKDDQMEMFQSINFVLMILITMYVLLIFITKRRLFSKVHRAIGTGLSNYDEETEIIRKSLRFKIHKKRKLLIKLLFSYFSILTFLVLLVEKHLNTYLGAEKVVLSPNLPITIWYPSWIPYDTSTVIGLSTALFLINLLCAFLVFVLCTFNFVAFIMCEYIAMEVKVLIHSLDRLPERTLHLYRLRHGDNTNVSIETIKENTDLSNCYRDCLKQNVIHHQNINKNFSACRDQLALVIWLTLAVCAVVIAISGVSLIRVGIEQFLLYCGNLL